MRPSPGWEPFGTASSVWLIRGNAGVSDWPNGGQEGEQFADFGNAPGTGIQQMITIPVGFTNPSLTWYDATLGVTPGGVLEFSTYTVRLRNSSDETVASGGYATNTDEWTQRSLALPALAAGSYILSFEATTGERQKDTLLDNVSLMPEPSAGMLACLAVPLIFRRGRAREER